MKISIIGSTKLGYELSKEDAMLFAGKSAGICYMPDTVETLLNEDQEKTIKRSNLTLKSRHHSVFCHSYYNLMLDGIPKILAIILNNERAYNTSEKSGRYTKMKASENEKVLYEKWLDIFNGLIREKYPDIKDSRVKILSQENARYLISAFTPATIMEYTVSFGQLNYILHFMRNYINDENKNSEFEKRLKIVFQEFLEAMPDIEVEELNANAKNRKLSLFSERKERKEEFGENYCTTYLSTFPAFAHLNRHRTLNYEISLLEENQFYTPPIIKGTKFEAQWLTDIKSLEKYFPQGMLIKVTERGTVEDFILKCKERLCGCVQIETQAITLNTLKKYIEATKDTNPEVYKYLLQYSKGPRCTFPDFKCENPCFWGAKGAFIREI